MKDYSQNGEQNYISTYFGGKANGNFLDVGANDGLTLSNTAALALRGWSGVYVEPSPQALDRLDRNIKETLLQGSPLEQNLEVLELAVMPSPGITTLHESGAHLGDDVSLVSTVLPAQRRRWKKETFTPVEVRGESMLNIIDYCGALGFDYFDFISIDIEGMDILALQGCIEAGLKPSMYCIEWDSDPKAKEDYEKLLGPDYGLYARTYENLIYVRE